MSGVLAEIQLVLVAAAAFLVLASFVATPAAHGIERATRMWDPAARHRALVVASAMPVVLGVAALLAAIAPSAIALAWTGTDHCATHDDGHAHLCLAHFPSHGPNGATWLVLALACAWLVAKATEGTADLVHARRIVRQLVRAATPDVRGCSVVASKRPLCVSVGLLDPRVLVSQGFLDGAEPTHVRAALHHEAAHVARKDALVRQIARAASVLYPAPTRRTLLAEIDIAAERACDERAAIAVGDRVSVAETILRLERLLQSDAELHSLALVRAVSAVAVPRRVESLLEPARVEGATTIVFCGVLAAVAALFTFSEPLHHAAESLLAAALQASP